MTKEIKGAQYINDGTDEQMVSRILLLSHQFCNFVSCLCFLKEISGFKSSFLKTFITWIFIIISFGFLRLIFYWKPEWMLKCTHERCSLNKATKALLKVLSLLSIVCL